MRFEALFNAMYKLQKFSKKNSRWERLRRVHEGLTGVAAFWWGGYPIITVLMSRLLIDTYYLHYYDQFVNNFLHPASRISSNY
jgi:hypothetical protein